MKRIIASVAIAAAASGAAVGAAAAATPAPFAQNVQTLAANYGYSVDTSKLNRNDLAFLYLTLNSADSALVASNAIKSVQQ
ncbi:hypothetical protein [Brevirhabdus sp.]|uniref:hypothetical protein n=1 Tax=Brevirhabdus sp. TaxID=2004514 RepID=UPI00405A2F29